VRDQILTEIRKLATEAGTPPGREAFERATGIRPASWLGVYWARWGDALKEAGYEPNSFQGKVEEQHLLRSFAEAVRCYGKIPTHAELRMFGKGRVDFPSHSTFTNSFQGRADLLARLTEWIEATGECSDISCLIPKLAAPAERKLPAKEGLVYLIKSGAHYKIGRSDELERRVKEIRIALPEAASLVHSIRTDDPAGIEAYWHRRFADRRANGEWFKLSVADVVAFKRRKFQ
jgi:hypothetical protein